MFAATGTRLEPSRTAAIPRIVLDTNVVLDWLLFEHLDGERVGRAIACGSLCWIATRTMRREYFDVLDGAMLQRRSPDREAHRRAWDAHCRLLDEPPAGGVARLRVADPDDQMFVDLALAERPAWLLSRDKALLALQPALRRHGVQVATPAGWRPAQATGPQPAH